MAIDVVCYKYDVGDLVMFKTYNGNTRSLELVMGLVVKRNMQTHFWHEEAEKKVFHSGHEILVYDVASETGICVVKESEIIKLISSKSD